MDKTRYLAQQVSCIIGQLHGLLDEIGVPSHEREARESELFSALSAALDDQVRLVTAEKKNMMDEAKKMMTAIRQVEASLGDSKPLRRSYDADDDEELGITYPLTRCLQVLKEKHAHISRLHRERYEQVKKLVEALESYSSHLEPTFVQIPLPPTGPNQSVPPTFDLSLSYLDRLDAEFTRVYDEYTQRRETVQALAEHMMQFWAELGTPQAQQDSAVVKHYRDAPEQLGLHDEDVGRLRAWHERLCEEKKSRERRLRELRTAVEALWDKLGMDEGETRAFVKQNRGCGMRQINEFEDELARLTELKRQNLHVFIEDARERLQDLWDAMYYSDDEMLDFTPAFSEVYSDALLEAHEREVARLEALREQRAPTLALVDKHKALMRNRDELAASSQDASRLMMRGLRGEKRDPGKLLREEKMRKRIAKELPRATAEVRKALARWEDEYGRPFLVYGERYLDRLDADEAAALLPAAKSGTLRRANSTKSAPARSMTKTPTGTRAQAAGGGSKGSPSRIPARVPLASPKHGANSPERLPRARSRAETLRNGALPRSPPPKMRDLASVPELEAPANPYKAAGMVRQVEPEDVYDDNPARSNSALAAHRRPGPAPGGFGDNGFGHYDDGFGRHDEARFGSVRAAHAPPPRQISSTSHSTAVSASENWETYNDNSEPEPDASETYLAKLRAARGKRHEPEPGPRPGRQQASKRICGIPPPAGYMGPVMVDHDGNRIISGSEWTDEDAS